MIALAAVRPRRPRLPQLLLFPLLLLLAPVLALGLVLQAAELATVHHHQQQAGGDLQEQQQRQLCQAVRQLA